MNDWRTQTSDDGTVVAHSESSEGKIGHTGHMDVFLRVVANHYASDDADNKSRLQQLLNEIVITDSKLPPIRSKWTVGYDGKLGLEDLIGDYHVHVSKDGSIVDKIDLYQYLNDRPRCNLKVEPEDDFDTLVKKAASVKTVNVTYWDVYWWYYWAKAFDPEKVKRIPDPKPYCFRRAARRQAFPITLHFEDDPIEGFVDFMLGINCLIHVMFMRAIEAGKTVQKYESPVYDNSTDAFVALLETRMQTRRDEPRYEASGMRMFDVAVQLEMIFANTYTEDELRPFVERIRARCGKDDAIFEIELIKYLSGLFQTFRIVGDVFKNQVIVIETDKMPHWAVMKETVEIPNDSFVKRAFTSRLFDF